ncbi:MAG: methyltransferase domain-containing protein [Planctomycetota bacterium]|nr:methyltransferase domain-containing protein [Planctomycetota bacterium]
MATTTPSLSPDELRLFQQLVYTRIGVRLGDNKHALVQNRLRSRLRDRQLSSFSSYHQLLTEPAESEEMELCINALTTNETYFYRHPLHWHWLSQHWASFGPAPRVWSAACSSGEEPYTVAIELACRGITGGEIIGSDINSSVLDQAKRASYSPYAVQKVEPVTLKERFRSRVRFERHNLMSATGPARNCDLVLLRNVLIYFDRESKRKVLDNILQALKPGGLLIIGGAEALTDNRFDYEAPSIYRKR